MTQHEGLALREASENVWSERETLFTEDVAVLRISTLPALVCEFADKLQRTQPDVQVTSVSQAIGLHEVALRGSPDAIRAVIRQLRADTRITVAILQSGQSIDAAPFAIQSPVLLLMQTLKRNFDPDGILNPGKFFDGA
jgi:glycolate oxidase FAD binding subunit